MNHIETVPAEFIQPTYIFLGAGIIRGSKTVAANSTSDIIPASIWSRGIGYIVSGSYLVRVFVAGNKIETVYKEGDNVTFGLSAGTLVVNNNTNNQITVEWCFVTL